MLALTSVEKRFGSARVLRGVSLSLDRGRCVCVAGGNAEGKTTLLSLAAGLLRPDAGQISADGAVALVLQQPALLDELSLSDNLRLWYAAHNRRERLFLPGSPELELGLAPFARRRAGRLSGGLRKRLSIATALAGTPSYLLLDEPFASLDAPACDRLTALLLSLKAKGVGLLLTSHDPARLTALADDALLLREGIFAERVALSSLLPERRLPAVLSLLFGGGAGPAAPADLI